MSEGARINTVYIMSKGRPQCVTARTLTAIGYPGEWFIVCGDNDETLSEYRRRWGDRVLVFDWRKYADKADLLDNFGVSDVPSGAVPARNAIRDISASRGEFRHWQFDDDFGGFKVVDDVSCTMAKVDDGAVLERALLLIAEFGYETNAANVGFSTSTFERWGSSRSFSRQVFCCHNMPVEGFTEWRGRVADDFVNCCDVYRRGGFEFSFNFVGYAYAQSCAAKGGNTDLYEATGYVRKAAYEVLAAPLAARLSWSGSLGRYACENDYRLMRPMIIHERWSHAQR